MTIDSGTHPLSQSTRYEKILILLFILTLPLANPWVRGDGVGYYAFARSTLIEHRLNFQKDWLHANESFRLGRLTPSGEIPEAQYTSTGHLDNHFTVGPAILWSPFLIAAHAGVLLFHALGGHVPADGFSSPYTVAMALGTTIYGFLAIWISFVLARKYLPERWAFLAALGVWFASSMPVYMYFNPSWSHAHSAFTVALFVWYWDRTQPNRSWAPWAILALIAGLMLDVYYPNAVLLVLPLLDFVSGVRRAIQQGAIERLGPLLGKSILFALLALAAFLPTLITKKIIYGSFLEFGYTERWFWSSPAIWKVSFSSEHGLFSWTPVILLAVLGLFLLRRRDPRLSFASIAVFVLYLYLIGCYENWHGLSSFGSRFFISLTIIFVLGLASFFDWLARALGENRARILAPAATALLVLWNLGLIFQWGTHLIPAREPISWRDAAYNQVAVVPVEATRMVKTYFTRRKQLMHRIEEQDVQHLKSAQPEPAN